MINPNTLEIHMLMEQHNPLLDTSGYMAAGIIGCDCDDRKFTSDSAYFEHLAGVLAAALPPAGEVEWKLQDGSGNIFTVDPYRSKEEAADGLNFCAEAYDVSKWVIVSRTVTPWQPAD